MKDMKFNWQAFLRLSALSFIVATLLQAADVPLFVRLVIGLALGLFYPEPVFVPKEGKNDNSAE